MILSTPQPPISEFDDVVVSALDWAGVNGVIVLLVGTAFAIQSWWGPARGVVVVTRRTVEGARKAAVAMVAVTPARRTVAAVVTALITAGQMGTLVVCYLNGNLISLFVHGGSDRSATSFASMREAVIDVDARAALGTLTADVFSVGYLALGVAALVMSYRDARDRPVRQWSGMPRLGAPETILAFPEVCVSLLGWVVLVLTAPFVALAVLFKGREAFDNFWNDTPFFGFAATVALCGLVWLACRMAVYGSHVVTQMWRPPASAASITVRQ